MIGLAKRILVYEGETLLNISRTYKEAVEAVLAPYDFYRGYIELHTNNLWGKTEKIEDQSTNQWILEDETINEGNQYHYEIISKAQKNYVAWQLTINETRRKHKKEEFPIICPRCNKSIWDNYSLTDEHDTYIGMKCHNCQYDYSISH